MNQNIPKWTLCGFTDTDFIRLTRIECVKMPLQKNKPNVLKFCLVHESMLAVQVFKFFIVNFLTYVNTQSKHYIKFN